MKRTLSVALLIAALAGGAAAQSDPRDRDWNRPVEPFRIVGDVYYVGMEGVGAFLVTTSEGHVLIDGGYEESAPIILRNIEALGFRPADVKWLLLSHAHYDHAGGLAALKAATGAKLVAGAGDREGLEAGRHVGDNVNGIARFPAVAVDLAVKDGDAIRLGGAVITAHATPGHTRGCTTWTLPVTEGGARHDVVFYCSTTVAGNVLVGNTAYPQVADDYRASFAALKRLHADVFLANHPSIFGLDAKRARIADGAPNPFVDPAELQAYVARSERAFDKALQAERATVQGGAAR